MTNDHAELKLLTLAEAAAILQISKRTLLRMIQQREVPAFKIGGQWRIRESQFRKWVEGKESLASDAI
jgi:excisionase family DNA binding protein